MHPGTRQYVIIGKDVVPVLELTDKEAEEIHDKLNNIDNTDEIHISRRFSFKDKSNKQYRDELLGINDEKK